MLKKSLLLFKIFLVKATKRVSSLFVCFIKAYFFLVSASYKIQINFEKLSISNYLTYFFLLCRVMATLFLFIRKKFFRRYRKYLGIFLEARGTIAQCFLSYPVAESCFQNKTQMWFFKVHPKIIITNWIEDASCEYNFFHFVLIFWKLGANLS